MWRHHVKQQHQKHLTPVKQGTNSEGLYVRLSFNGPQATVPCGTPENTLAGAAAKEATKLEQSSS